jgi:hypothetical protein
MIPGSAPLKMAAGVRRLHGSSMIGLNSAVRALLKELSTAST